MNKIEILQIKHIFLLHITPMHYVLVETKIKLISYLEFALKPTNLLNHYVAW